MKTKPLQLAKEIAINICKRLGPICTGPAAATSATRLGSPLLGVCSEGDSGHAVRRAAVHPAATRLVRHAPHTVSRRTLGGVLDAFLATASEAEPAPHLHRDGAGRCTGTSLTAATSAPGLGARTPVRNWHHPCWAADPACGEGPGCDGGKLRTVRVGRRLRRPPRRMATSDVTGSRRAAIEYQPTRASR